MKQQDFYRQLFAPLEARLGPLDPETLTGIIGFDAGGPISRCTLGRNRSPNPVTYVTCELACRKNQKPSPFGRYEILVTCDDPDWAQEVLTGIGQMSLETTFAPGHTLDISPWVGMDAPIQGVLFDLYLRSTVPHLSLGFIPSRRSAAILSIHGLRRDELDFAVARGAPALKERLEAAGQYQVTRVARSQSAALSL